MRAGRTGKTAYLQIGVWYDQKDHIHLAAKNESFITTVNNDPGSMRGHPHLFAKLAKFLKEAGKPHPDIDVVEA